MTTESLFHVMLVGELAVSITKERGDMKIGLSIKEIDGKFYAVYWQSESGRIAESETIPIKKGSPHDVILHPRAKREIFDLLKMKSSSKTDSIVSLYDLLMLTKEGEK